MKALLLLALLLGSTAFAQESDVQTSPVTNAAIQLDCDTQVDGGVCPSKYASKPRLTDDTNIRENSTTPKATEGAE